MSSGAPAPQVQPGRSLWSDAFTRLKRNRAAVASALVLIAITLASVFGPMLTGHAFDRTYPEYSRVPPSLSAYPKPDQIEPALKRLGARMRVEVAEYAIAGATVSAVLRSTRAVDERNLAFIERSDMFGKPAVTARADEGRVLTVSIPIERQYFFFGTDTNGRDQLTRVLFAGRISLAIGLLAAGVGVIIGVLYGATAGFLGGRIDDVMMRIVDIIYALPFIFFVIMLVVFFGRNFVLMFLAVGAVEWLDMARIVRGQTLSIKRQEYVTAAEALGVTGWGILKRHIIPNTLGPVIVYLTLLVPKVILLESFLSFLGLGVQEPMSSWGVMISDGARSIQGDPYLLIFPALFLTTTLFALNFLGDGLRDALDPKDR